MPRTSAGLLMFRRRDGALEVLLAHPGGPLWANKDLGAWTLPKGEIAEGEDAVATARREFEEETGIRPEGVFYPLGSIEQKGGKIVHAWAFQARLRPVAKLPRSRPRGVVLPGRSAAADQPRAGELAGCARKSGFGFLGPVGARPLGHAESRHLGAKSCLPSSRLMCYPLCTRFASPTVRSPSDLDRKKEQGDAYH